MGNHNKKYFRHVYSERWIAGQEARAEDHLHYWYQQITLDYLDCFPGCTIFECGCGSGELLLRLAREYDSIQLFGADLGRDSLLHAKNSSLEKYTPHLIEGDMTMLPIRSNSFDRVFASSVLWYVSEPHFAIQEMIRILRPGGKFVFDVRNPFHITNIFTKFSLILKRFFLEQMVPHYTFFSLKDLRSLLSVFPITYQIRGFYLLLPTRLPILGKRWGSWVSVSDWLSYEAGYQKLGQNLSQKLLVIGTKLG